ncbi:MAG: hypothetical protein KDC24_09585 [Saprospiraceae bacterium]|nr:hypothetical protein [Saprospiraceae bacterium]
MENRILIFSLLVVLLILSSCNKEPAPFYGEYIQNSSFEQGTPGFLSLPDGWLDCGFEGETPPDLFANDMEIRPFEVSNNAIEGNQFVGMVVRDNGTRECIIQRLVTPISGLYTLRLLIGRAEEYLSISRVTYDPISYNQPVELEVIGIGEDGREEVLFRAPKNVKRDWIEIQTSIYIPFPISSLKLSPDFDSTRDTPYCGNVLIDAFELY